MSMIERLPALTGSMWSAISVTMAVSWRAIVDPENQTGV